MPYTIPQYPLIATRFSNAGLGDYTLANIGDQQQDFRCNLTWGRRVNMVATGGTAEIGVLLSTMTLLFPGDTILHGPEADVGFDFVMVADAVVRYYAVVFRGDVGLGFSNWHGAALLYPVPGGTLS